MVGQLRFRLAVQTQQGWSLSEIEMYLQNTEQTGIVYFSEYFNKHSEIQNTKYSSLQAT